MAIGTRCTRTAFATGPKVEAVIFHHAKVQECAVFGIPDERLGERVAAAVMVKPAELLTEGVIQSYVGEHLARFRSRVHHNAPSRQWVHIFSYSLRFLFATQSQVLSQELRVVYQAIST